MSNTEKWWKKSLSYSSRTDIGMRRTNNQDSRSSLPAATMRLWRSRGHLFVVADGMGAHAAGELASQIATDSIPQCYLKKPNELPRDAIRNAILDTHYQIKRQGREEEAFRDMGTTVDVLLILPEGAIVAHVGDSRVYRLRKGIYEQLTFDHSLFWEIKRSGRVPEDRIPAYIPRNIITRSLGPTENLVVDIEGPLPIEPGDTFLLCSDGLSGQMEDTEMGQILQLFPPDEATETLVNLANLRGGPDNITVTVVKILELPPSGDYIKDDPVYEKRPHISTFGWSLLAMMIATFIPVFSIFIPKLDYRIPISIISLILTLLFLTLFLLVSRRTFFPASVAREEGDPLGAAPYANASAIPSSLFAERFTEIKKQLVDALRKQDIVQDWQKVRKWEKLLAEAVVEKNCGEIIRYNAKIVNYLMAEVKKISSEKSRDK